MGLDKQVYIVSTVEFLLHGTIDGFLYIFFTRFRSQFNGIKLNKTVTMVFQKRITYLVLWFTDLLSYITPKCFIKCQQSNQ